MTLSFINSNNNAILFAFLKAKISDIENVDEQEGGGAGLRKYNQSTYCICNIYMYGE